MKAVQPVFDPIAIEEAFKHCERSVLNCGIKLIETSASLDTYPKSLRRFFIVLFPITVVIWLVLSLCVFVYTIAFGSIVCRLFMILGVWPVYFFGKMIRTVKYYWGDLPSDK